MNVYPLNADESIEPDPVVIPIEDSLDLHTFRPEDVKALLPEYFHQAILSGFDTVRIIHGKGQGVLKRITESICTKDSNVVSFETADEMNGGWGSTIVRLKKQL